jgi:3-oxoacyl-[acyl-carrier protein] reductase
MRNVLVTGGSRGLGLAISKKLSGAGYNTIAIARKESPELTTAIAAFGNFNSKVLHFVPFDLAEIDPVHAECHTCRVRNLAIFSLQISGT